MKHVRKPHHVREKIRHAKDKFIQKEKDIAQMFKRRKHGGAAVAGEGGTKHKKKLDTEKDLMNKSWQKFERRSNVKIFNPEEKSIQDQIVNGKITVDNTKKTGGFMVLGMHRSGTSMLAGLLVEGFGYQPGKPLIQPAYDNAKGFYELVPAVLQNDVFMDAQGVDWSANVVNYNPEVALESYTQGRIKFERGANALRVLNNPANIPWLQKDPRMCITMRTWLPLLNTKPAVIFTYRNPLEVAMSLKKRQGFKLSYGLRLWINYNIAAVKNSVDLCRVYSSNTAVLADPLNEVKKIAKDLETKCGVPPPPKMITQEIVDSFVDSSLQHHKKGEEKATLATYGDCVVKDFDSEEKEGSPGQNNEMDLYMKAMKLYCDFDSGDAYEDNYEWPVIGSRG